MGEGGGVGGVGAGGGHTSVYFQRRLMGNIGSL